MSVLSLRIVERIESAVRDGARFDPVPQDGSAAPAGAILVEDGGWYLMTDLDAVRAEEDPSAVATLSLWRAGGSWCWPVDESRGRRGPGTIACDGPGWVLLTDGWESATYAWVTTNTSDYP